MLTSVRHLAPNMGHTLTGVTVRVLSIKQPWATLIVHGIKRFEARTWQTPFRGRIALHASSGVASGIFDVADQSDALGDVFCRMGWCDATDLKALPRTSVVGTVEIESIHPATEIWEELTDTDRALVGDFEEPPTDLYLWRLRDPRVIQPVGVNGKLNLWTLPDDIASEVKRGEALSPHTLPDASAEAVLRARAARNARIEAARTEREQFRARPVRLLDPLPALVGFAEGTMGAFFDASWEYIRQHLHPKGGVVVTPEIQALFKRKRAVVDADELFAAAEPLIEYLD